MKRKRDMCLWNPLLLRSIVIYLILATLIAILACYPFMGYESLYFLFAGIAAPIIGLIYGFVGKLEEMVGFVNKSPTWFCFA
ncbi:hypothetical protein H8E88_24820 [candidate division KSB1 bacterium]|nr:hypothetical protein [candidate division KSB1 bacterium]